MIEAKEIMDRLRLTPLTQHTTTDLQHMSEKVEAARVLGFSFDEQENEDGIVCFGAPIRDGSGLPVAYGSISIPMFRLNTDKTHYSRPLVSRCAEISKMLGFI